MDPSRERRPRIAFAKAAVYNHEDLAPGFFQAKVVEEPLKARQVSKARDLPLGNDGQRLDMLGQIISW